VLEGPLPARREEYGFNNGSAIGFAMYFDILAVLLFGLIWIGIVTFLLLKKKKKPCIFDILYYILRLSF
jgi:hypothetical protein